MYGYKTKRGERFRCVWRSSDGKQQSKSGFESQAKAGRYLRHEQTDADRGRPGARVRQGVAVP